MEVKVGRWFFMFLLLRPVLSLRQRPNIAGRRGWNVVLLNKLKGGKMTEKEQQEKNLLSFLIERAIKEAIYDFVDRLRMVKLNFGSLYYRCIENDIKREQLDLNNPSDQVKALKIIKGWINYGLRKISESIEE